MRSHFSSRIPRWAVRCDGSPQPSRIASGRVSPTGSPHNSPRPASRSNSVTASRRTSSRTGSSRGDRNRLDTVATRVDRAAPRSVGRWFSARLRSVECVHAGGGAERSRRTPPPHPPRRRHRRPAGLHHRRVSARTTPPRAHRVAVSAARARFRRCPRPPVRVRPVASRRGHVHTACGGRGDRRRHRHPHRRVHLRALDTDGRRRGRADSRNAADDRLARDLEGSDIDVHLVGDAHAPRRIFNAIWEGENAARRL